MDTNQPASQPVYTPAAAAPGVFAGKIPSSVTFIIGILLFLLPFSELKCGGTTFANKSGLDIIMSKDWKSAGAGGFNKNELQTKTLSTGGEEKGQTQIYGIVALVIAAIGLMLSLAGNTRLSAAGGIVSGVLSAGALIGLMLELKKVTNNLIAKKALEKTSEGIDSLGFDKIGSTLSSTTKVSIGFTPWFYIAIIAFLAAAFFSYRRMSAVK